MPLYVNNINPIIQTEISNINGMHSIKHIIYHGKNLTPKNLCLKILVYCPII